MDYLEFVGQMIGDIGMTVIIGCLPYRLWFECGHRLLGNPDHVAFLSRNIDKAMNDPALLLLSGKRKSPLTLLILLEGQ